MDFHIAGLDPQPFAHLFGKSDVELAAAGVTRHRVDAFPSFPDRITLCDLPIGTTALLLNYEHQPAPTAYRASHAIYLGEDGAGRFDAINTMPQSLALRLLSLRAFDATGMMRDAEVVEGADAATVVRRMLRDPAIAYVHAHYAKRGCFAATIERA